MKNLKEYLEKSIPIIKELIYNSEEKHLKIDKLDDLEKFKLMTIYSKILQKIEKDEQVRSILGKIYCPLLDTNDLEKLLSSYLKTGDSKDITDYFKNKCKKKSGGSQSGGYKNKTHKNKRHKKSKKSKKSKKNNSKRNMVFFGGAYPQGFPKGEYDECPICLEDFKDPNDYIVLHQGNHPHNFHRNCIANYSIKTRNSCINGQIVCPTCKRLAGEFPCPQGNNANNAPHVFVDNNENMQRGFDPLREQLNDEMEQLIQMQHLLHGHARMPNGQELLEDNLNRHQIVRFLKEILRILPRNISRAMNDIDVIMFMTVIIFFIKSLFDRP